MSESNPSKRDTKSSKPGIPDSGHEDDQPTLAPSAGFDDQATLAPGTKPNQDKESASDLSFGDYEIIEEIARGGMGVVYRATQKSLNRTVALKMILAGQLASEEEVRRFQTEAESAAKLDHPNIVPIYEINSANDRHFFSMKYIEGSDLGSEMERLRNDLKSAVELLERVCRGVHHAHKRGILHRDLKPANILIDEKGEPYITDLGLARSVGTDSHLTRTGAIVGTPSYMPPEQAAGNSDITTSADVYSLGAILYELLTGKPPFVGATPMDTLMLVVNSEVERPSLSGFVDRSLEMIALKCLAKNPEQRYESAEDLADDLLRWLNGEPIGIRAPSFLTLARSWMRQNFGRAGWILVIGLLGGIAAGMSFWMATVQQSMDENRRVYDVFTSVDAPFALLPFSTPDFLALPLMIVFVVSVSLMGFFTAWLVQTKNRSADIAAGLIVGVIAGAAAFFAGFGPISVLTGIQIEQDTGLLNELVVAKSEGTPEQIVVAYPELENLSRPEQSRLLINKIASDQIHQVPRALLLGSISVLVIFLVVGIAETAVAGPIIRKQKSFVYSLLGYGFSSYPFIFSTIIFGLHIAAFFVLGHVALVWNWLWTITLFVLVLAVVSQLLRWSFSIRLPIFLASLIVLCGYLAFSFPMIPGIARGNSAIKRSLKLAADYPKNDRLKVEAANSMLDYGVMLYEFRRYRAADKAFVRSNDYIQAKLKSTDNAVLKSMFAVGVSNRADCLAKLGEFERGYDVLRQAIAENSSNLELYAKAVDVLFSGNREDLARKIVADIEINDAASYRIARQLIGKLERASGSATEDWVSKASSSINERLKRSRLERDLASRLAERSMLQHWSILRPVGREFEDEIDNQLESMRAYDEASLLKARDAIVYNAFDGFMINLGRLFPEAPSKTRTYAIGRINSETNQKVRFCLGSDDGAQVWVNGQRVHQRLINRAYIPRQDKFEVELQEGENLVVIKIIQVGGRWQFGLDIDDPYGWPAPVDWINPSRK